MNARDDLDLAVYDWLTARFGERAAEGLVPCPGHAWPLTEAEQNAAHAHYEQWAEKQTCGVDIDAAEYAMEDR